ncbi:ecdysteroid-regulated 16 kDa protein-like [Mercenaria mercenaria]|uniref:ecdysteroid-regulated 16 kDa protein-like n=1 Tax=Mercenaria mercenaria TaxID=6596 RepID=UPI00234EF625|nr:ecdysteroid-regulated 16 kDa protein-like [Mercenaria mercenaria]
MDKYIMNIFCIVVLFVVSVYGAWKPCGGPATVAKVLCNGEDVNKKTECILTKGKNATLQVTFKTTKGYKSVSSVCHGIIGGVPVPFEGIDEKGCDGMNPKCPIAAGITETFTTNIFVKSIYPSIRLVIKWEEVDASSNEDMWCLLIPAQIK